MATVLSTNIVSTSKSTRKSALSSLIASIDRAMNLDSVEQRVGATLNAVAEAASHTDLLPAELLKTNQESYARRSLYIDPAGRYSVLAMVWDKGQGTPLHDHGGLWVVECLYRGKMRVTNFDYLGEENGVHKFNASSNEQVNPGDTDYRVPPDEHHVVCNDSDAPAVTLHVFGGILENCHCYEPVEGGYRRLDKKMAYTD
jgi:predicted metal-dependent enzyme (double-stranded beta helix superfamily)